MSIASCNYNEHQDLTSEGSEAGLLGRIPAFSQTSPKILINFLVCAGSNFAARWHFLAVCKDLVSLYSLFHVLSHLDP